MHTVMDKDHILRVVTLPRHYLIIQTNVVIMHTRVEYACNARMHTLGLSYSPLYAHMHTSYSRSMHIMDTT